MIRNKYSSFDFYYSAVGTAPRLTIVYYYAERLHGKLSNNTMLQRGGADIDDLKHMSTRVQ